MMRAKTFTPVVQSLCKNFDKRLASRSDDYTFYMFPYNDDVTMVTLPRIATNYSIDTQTQHSYRRLYKNLVLLVFKGLLHT